MNFDVAQLKAEYNDLPTSARVALVSGTVVEIAAKVAALVDIPRRPAGKIRGPKWAWVAAQAVNGFGPAAYWLFARKR